MKGVKDKLYDLKTLCFGGERKEYGGAKETKDKRIENRVFSLSLN